MPRCAPSSRSGCRRSNATTRCARSCCAARGRRRFAPASTQGDHGESRIGRAHTGAIPDGTPLLFDRLAHCPKPTLAVVEGVALGGGLELAACCDFIIAGERARFGLPEIKLGAIPAAGGTVRVTRQIGPVRARQLILLGDPIDAATALAMGPDRARRGAGRASRRRAPISRSVLRRHLRVQCNMPSARSWRRRRTTSAARRWRWRATMQRGLSASADLAEGVRSFLERRSPVFQRHDRSRALTAAAVSH